MVLGAVGRVAAGCPGSGRRVRQLVPPDELQGRVIMAVPLVLATVIGWSPLSYGPDREMGHGLK